MRDPYAPPGWTSPAAPKAAPPMRSGALMVLLGELGRSILWRLNGGIGLWYRAWPDTTLPNRLIKLAGAVLVLWGAWTLTRERVPAVLRMVTRSTATIALGGHVARVVFALTGVPALAAEPATMLLDGLAVSACILCVASALRSGPTPHRAIGVVFLAGTFLAVSIASVLLRLADGGGAHITLGVSTLLRGAISLAMLGLGAWAIVAVVRLPRSG
jgi:hypothetical protein